MNWLKNLMPLKLANSLKKQIIMLKSKILKKKILNIAGLAINNALNAVENKIPNVSALVKKSNFDDKIKEIESKYLTTSDLGFFLGKNVFGDDGFQVMFVNQLKLNTLE